jgi:hypothetical protein
VEAIEMSEQEQHEIIGRNVVDHGDAKRRLAALEAKARDYANSMRIVANDLAPAGVIYTGSGAGYCGGTIKSALEKYPSKSDVVELLEEIGLTKRRIDELAKSLRDMGAAV